MDKPLSLQDYQDLYNSGLIFRHNYVLRAKLKLELFNSIDDFRDFVIEWFDSASPNLITLIKINIPQLELLKGTPLTSLNIQVYFSTYENLNVTELTIILDDYPIATDNPDFKYATLLDAFTEINIEKIT